ncbi:DUF6051 family protein [Carboxylicivirga sp. M1479]|uniref:DUF6051 family protein n=1 Tax=Carboxylicivirga sp. M1479 TaxID=2594476 RepID=UPI0011779594|nr:DUF6051 family protein [Carboxylicivirga sp. M1479]TRX72138.1 hypothetical protein FNN09_01845 [Carboxylicivirga sp. M1479]
MNYFFLYQTLKEHLLSGVATLPPDKDAFGISIEEFHSKSSVASFTTAPSAFDLKSGEQEKNNHFTYPMFRPLNNTPTDGCIILLHGLNERSWEKYLPWAYQLANNTNKSVILFPIAYHMNRSPKAWCDPRQMTAFVKNRKVQLPQVKGLSVANVALSERLTNHPERFLLSGFQAANDILALVKEIKLGKHAGIKKDGRIDFFAYSIGSFLAQIMFLAHGERELAKSKLFIFCGGSAFADWQGISKYIMDSRAFETLHSYYNKAKVEGSEQVNDLLSNTRLGQSFVDMLSLSNLRQKGEHYFAFMKDRLSAVVLKNDSVVIADTVKKTLKGMHFEEWDLNYPYSHIMPFPLLSNKLVNQVNEAFDKLMSKSALLFTTC